MKTANAIKKLQRAGLAVNKVEGMSRYYSDTSNDRISFHDQDGEAICIFVRPLSQKDDPITDYFPGVRADSIAQALRLASK